MDSHVKKDTSGLRRKGDEKAYERISVAYSKSFVVKIHTGGILLVQTGSFDSVDVAECTAFNHLFDSTIRFIV